MTTDKNEPAPDDMYDGMSKEEIDKHMEESFQFGTNRSFQLMDDALDRELDAWAVSSQMLHTAAFVMSQHGVGLDDMMTECKDAIKRSNEMEKAEAVNKQIVEEGEATTDKNEDIIDALRDQGSKPTPEA